MTLSDLAKQASFLAATAGPAAREAARQQALIDARAIGIKQRVPLTDDVARLVAWFTFGGWAQRWPVKGYDIGEGATEFVAEWLWARNLGSVDAMHAALGEWRAGEFARELNAAFDARHSEPLVVDVDALAACAMKATERP